MTQDNTQPKTLKIPQSLVPFIDVFSADHDNDARLLFEQAIWTIYPKGARFIFKRNDLKVAFNLVRSMKPKNDLEKVLCAQFIVSHLLGMRKLAQGYFKDKRMALKLLKLSNGAMSRLCDATPGNIAITK